MGCERYFPLTAGRFWDYRISLGNRDAGQLQQQVVTGRRRATSSFWKMERRVAGDEPQSYAVVAGDTEVRIATAAVLRAPLEPGAAWRDADEEGFLTYEVTRTGFVEEVPAGTFTNCIEVTAHRDGTEAQRTIYAPDTGMIKHRAPTPGGWLELVLVATGQRH